MIIKLIDFISFYCNWITILDCICLKADYQWVIMLNRICLSFFGVWPETGKTVHRKRKLMMNIRVITILTLITCVCIIPSLHSLIRIWGNITSVTDNLQYNVPICISMIKLIVIWHKQEGKYLVKIDYEKF